MAQRFPSQLRIQPDGVRLPVLPVAMDFKLQRLDMLQLYLTRLQDILRLHRFAGPDQSAVSKDLEGKRRDAALHVIVERTLSCQCCILEVIRQLESCERLAAAGRVHRNAVEA